MLIEANHRRIKVDDIDVYAAAVYGDYLAQIILLAKEENNSDARQVLVDLISGQHLLREKLEGSTNLLIPIPSSSRANRKRGFKHSHMLAAKLAKVFIAEFGIHMEVAAVLHVNRRVEDQSLLNREERSRNLDGAYSISPRHLSERSFGNYSRGFLVDDLVTTGASIREAVRCLHQAGIRPLGAVCAGVSPHLFS